MDCWTFMDCPEEARRRCPAYPNNGKNCWKMPHTMCGGGRHALKSIVEKVSFCRNCAYFKRYVSMRVINHIDNPVVGGEPLE